MPERNKVRISIIIILIGFILVLSGIYVFMYYSPGFNLTQINIQGNRKIDEKEILERAGIKMGANIFSLDLGKMEQQIREDKRIKKVWVKRKLPQAILIEVEEKKPALWINLPDGLYGLSKEQEIIPLKEEDFQHDFPVVTGLVSSSFLEKENLSPKSYEWWPNRKIKSALEFYKALVENDSSFMDSISEISLADENDLIFYLIPYGTQVNMGKGNFKKKIGRVKSLLEYEKKREALVCIDLRFKDQVVVKKSLPELTPSGSGDSKERLPQRRSGGVGKKQDS
jgi:cell division protein FtsQ